MATNDLGNGSLDATLQDDRALAPGDFQGGHESRARLIPVVAAERQQAHAAQAIDLGQVEANSGFVDSGDRAIEMSEAIRRPASGQQTSAARPR